MSLDLAAFGAGGGAYLEIGTRDGTGVVAALNAGFREIHSVEADATLHQAALTAIADSSARITSSANVCLYHGDRTSGLALLAEKFRHRQAHFAFSLAAYEFDIAPLSRDLSTLRRMLSGILRQPPIFLLGAAHPPDLEWPDYHWRQSTDMGALVPDWWEKSSALLRR